MKIIEFHKGIMKIMKIMKYHMIIVNGNHTIPCKNQDNYENHWIPNENQRNHGKHIISKENKENY